MIQQIRRRYHDLLSDTRFSEIFTGSIWALSGQVIATALALAFSVLLARLYGAEMVGIVAVINSFLILVTTFTVLGINTSILRLIPEHIVNYSPSSAFKVYRKSQCIVIAISVITAAISFFTADIIAAKVFSKSHLSYYFGVASIFVVFRSMMLLNTSAVRGLRLVKVFALMQLLPQACNLFFLIIVGAMCPSKDVPVYSLIFGFTVTGIAGWFIVEFSFKKIIQPDDFVFSMPCWSILSISLPMLMTATMNFIIGETGVLMLGIFRADAEVGYYSVAVRLSSLTVFVLLAVNSTVGPKFSELFHSGKVDDLFYVAQKSAALIFVTTTPILLFLLIFGKFILGIVFGHPFTIAYPALVFVVIGQFVNSISGSSDFFMNMTGNQNIFRNIMTITAFMNFSLNLLLIPHLGINGAAIGAMISLFFWNIATLSYIKIKFGKTTGFFPQITLGHLKHFLKGFLK